MALFRAFWTILRHKTWCRGRSKTSFGAHRRDFMLCGDQMYFSSCGLEWNCCSQEMLNYCPFFPRLGYQINSSFVIWKCEKTPKGTACQVRTKWSWANVSPFGPPGSRGGAPGRRRPDFFGRCGGRGPKMRSKIPVCLTLFWNRKVRYGLGMEAQPLNIGTIKKIRKNPSDSISSCHFFVFFIWQSSN